MPVSRWLLVLLAAWLLAAALLQWVVRPWLRRGPRSDEVLGILWRLTRRYCRWWHRLEVEHPEIMPARDGDHEGLILVSNHTSHVDPFLLQSTTAAWIRWMMARDMMWPSLDWAWRLQSIIPVDRDGGDPTALREAMRHVKGGGCVGVFPEARLVIPHGEVRPFLAGVGVLATRTGAPVVLAWISGTPETRAPGATFRARSHARIRFLGPFRFTREDDPVEVTETLRRRLAEASGWPLVDEPLPPFEPAGTIRA